MAEYNGCFVGEDGLIHLGMKVKRITNIDFIDRLLVMFYPEESPSIKWTKKEIEKSTGKKHNKGTYYVKSAEGIKIRVNIE
ncbi:MAG: hypothetical protein AABX11_02825 [Nanoarchaeota archaeon]